jgi:hypothetical protein
VPVLIISSVASYLVSYNTHTPNYSIGIAASVFSVATTVLQAIMAFFEFKKLSTQYLNIANSYDTLANLIETQLYIK